MIRKQELKDAEIHHYSILTVGGISSDFQSFEDMIKYTSGYPEGSWDYTIYYKCQQCSMPEIESYFEDLKHHCRKCFNSSEIKNMKLVRKDTFGDKITKYVLSNENESLYATLIQSPVYDYEMEIRIVFNNERFKIIGSKSIMSTMTYAQFERKVRYHVAGHVLCHK